MLIDIGSTYFKVASNKKIQHHFRNFNIFIYMSENDDNMTINDLARTFSNYDQNKDTSESDIIRNPVNNLKEEQRIIPKKEIGGYDG
jgi:hypothetical protein